MDEDDKLADPLLEPLREPPLEPLLDDLLDPTERSPRHWPSRSRDDIDALMVLQLVVCVLVLTWGGV